MSAYDHLRELLRLTESKVGVKDTLSVGDKLKIKAERSSFYPTSSTSMQPITMLVTVRDVLDDGRVIVTTKKKIDYKLNVKRTQLTRFVGKPIKYEVNSIERVK